MMRYFIDMCIDRKIQRAYLEVRVRNNVAINPTKSLVFETYLQEKDITKTAKDAYVILLILTNCKTDDSHIEF